MLTDSLLGLWERWRGVPVSNVVSWGAITLLLFVACYKAWLHEHEATEYYKETLEPKMELVFRHESPYEACTHYGLYGKYRDYYRIVRVGVLNTSPRDTIYSVSVTLKDFIHEHRSFNGVPFRKKDNWASTVSGKLLIGSW